MKLEEGEYTTQSFIEFLKKTYGNKIGGKEFTANDIAQYLLRGYTPYRYGNLKITASTQDGIRIIKVAADDKAKKVKNKK